MLCRLLRGFCLLLRFVDPDLLGDCGWLGAAGEALGVAVVGVGEGGGALLADQVGGAEVDGCRGVQADAAVAVLVVVVGDEAIAPLPCLGEGVEGVGVLANATKLRHHAICQRCRCAGRTWRRLPPLSCEFVGVALDFEEHPVPGPHVEFRPQAPDVALACPLGDLL